MFADFLSAIDSFCPICCLMPILLRSGPANLEIVFTSTQLRKTFCQHSDESSFWDWIPPFVRPDQQLLFKAISTEKTASFPWAHFNNNNSNGDNKKKLQGKILTLRQKEKTRYPMSHLVQLARVSHPFWSTASKKCLYLLWRQSHKWFSFRTTSDFRFFPVSEVLPYAIKILHRTNDFLSIYF